jgi:hypothetical protein
MTNFEKCVDGSGWLSMARTDPDWRRRGVALFLQDQIAGYAKRRRITTLRLLTSSKNRASINACKKGGFRQVCEATHITCTMRTRKQPSKIQSSSSPLQMQSLLKSNYLSMMNGYIGHKWHFVKLTKRLLKRLKNEDELYVADDSVLLITKPERRFAQPQSTLAILNGRAADSLRDAKKIASSLGARVLSSYIPYSPYQLSVAEKLGFRTRRWSKHCLVFEKRTA